MAQHTLAAFSSPAYRTFWIGLTVNYAALWTSFVTRGFLAFELTESVTALAGLQLSFGVPMLLLSLYGGMIADRFPRKYVLMATIGVLSASFAAQAIVVYADVVEYWMLFATGVVEGVVVAALFPARMAIMAELVPEERAGNAVALGQVSFNTARIILPTIAGTVIAIEALGVGGAMTLVALLYLAALLIYARVPLTTAAAHVERQSPLAEIKEGMAYLRSQPALRYVLVLTLAVTSTLMPYFGFIPAVVDDLFDGGSVKLGIMTSGVAIGALAASIFGARIAEHRSALRARMFAAYWFASVMIAFALSPTYEVALIAGMALGAGEVAFISLNQSLSIRLSARAFRGRVQSIISLAFAAFGVISLPIGIAADVIGLRETLLLQGCTALVLITLAELYGRRIEAATHAASVLATGHGRSMATNEEATAVHVRS